MSPIGNSPNRVRRLLLWLAGLLVGVVILKCVWLLILFVRKCVAGDVRGAIMAQFLAAFILSVVWIVGFAMLIPKVKGGHHIKSNPGAGTGTGRWRGPL